MMKLWQPGAAIVGPYRRLWLGLYFGKLLLALMITLPVLALVQAELDYSSFARPLLQEWSVDVIGELIATSENVFSFGLLMLSGFAVIAFLVKQFLNGGIYDCLANRSPIQGERFFAQSFRMFRPHLTIGLWMIIIYILLFLTAVFFGEVVKVLVRKLFPSQDLVRFVIRITVTYAVVLIGAVYSDLVRIHLTISRRQAPAETNQPAAPRQGVGTSFKAGYLFLVQNSVKSMGVYAVYFVPFVVIWLAIEGLALLVTGSLGNMFGGVIEFLLFQLCSVTRVWQSLSGSLALADLMKHYTAPEPDTLAREATVDGPTVLP